MTARPSLAPCPWCGQIFEVASVSEGSSFRWRKVDGCCGDGPEVRHDTEAEDQEAAEDDSHARAIAAWNRRAAPPPAGWVAVPAEPTPEMLRAGFLTGSDEFEIDQPADAPSLVWQAMLAAAPPQPAPVAEGDPVRAAWDASLPSGDGPLTHAERKDAEQAYTVTAFDYVSAPVGSRDWSLYWRGWWHRATHYTAPQPAPESGGAQGEAVCYGIRRKGTLPIIGVIPLKVAEHPASSEEYSQRFEEVPLFLAPPSPDARVAELVRVARVSVLAFELLAMDRSTTSVDPAIRADELRAALAGWKA